MNPSPESVPPPVQQKKKSLLRGTGLLVSAGLVTTVVMVMTAVWINWPKKRTVPEPLPRSVASLISRLPGTSDALIYVGLKDIRESRFWREVLPDSIRSAPLFEPDGSMRSMLAAGGVSPARDIDTLLVSFRQRGYKGQYFIAVASGRFPGISDARLASLSREVKQVGAYRCYGVDSTLWVAPLRPGALVVSNDRQMMEGFLVPQGSFFERDSLSTALVNRTLFKSHLWFAMPSGSWTAGALRSLMSKNRDVGSFGNLNRIQNLSLSVALRDTVQAESEWGYRDNKSAWFASTFLWGTIRLSGLSQARTSAQMREVLDNIDVHQNLSSVMIRTKMPVELFIPGKEGR